MRLSRALPDPACAVSVSELWKRYGHTDAVRGVGFDVRAGEIFGLLGPNGAGKTTTLECVLGLCVPDRGSIRIHGLDVRSDGRDVRLIVGAQLQAASLQDKITPREALDLFGSFYPDAYRSGELLDRLGLQAQANAAFATLSGGLRQRLFLALALVNRPALLVLDEPTAGLDPRARRDLRELILAMRDEGRTVLLSTHDLEEAGQICDRVAIMDAGRIVAIASPAELIARAKARSSVVVRTSPPLTEASVAALDGVSRAVAGDGGWALETGEPGRLLAQVATCAETAGAELLDIELRRPTLEDVFLELTGREWAPGETRASQ